MEIRNYKDMNIHANPHGAQVNKIYDTDHALVMHMMLKPGQSLKPHFTPVDVAFYVLEGTPTIMVGDEKIQVKQDDIVESPKDIIHCIYNESDANIRVLVMKLPKPLTKSKMA
jgi:mannose-6-phosphate isomerase-like protein (cupin superfamily)